MRASCRPGVCQSAEFWRRRGWRPAQWSLSPFAVPVAVPDFQGSLDQSLALLNPPGGRMSCSCPVCRPQTRSAAIPVLYLRPEMLQPGTTHWRRGVTRKETRFFFGAEWGGGGEAARQTDEDGDKTRPNTGGRTEVEGPFPGA